MQQQQKPKHHANIYLEILALIFLTISEIFKSTLDLFRHQRKDLRGKVALVTGANQGIGLEICKKFVLQPNLVLLVGARDEKKGADAVSQLKDISKNEIIFIKIDLDNNNTIREASEFVKSKYGGLDILVNNAGMAFKGDTFDENVATITIDANYYGTKAMCEYFVPLIREGGRVVNVSSLAGKLSRFGGDLQNRFNDPNLTVEQLDGIMKEFIQSVKDGSYSAKGYIKSTYGVSKVGVSTYTRILQRNEKRKDVIIFAVCPGYCSTSMSSFKGTKTSEEGARTPVWLALQEPNSNLQMGFYTENTLTQW